MMEKKDWLSLFIGLIIFLAGLFPLLNKLNMGPSWFSLEALGPIGNMLPYIVAGIGFYLMINSVIEITNSNSVGWISFLIAVIVLALGVLQVLSSFGIGPSWFALSFIKGTIYNVIFLVQGIFLMIAAFAMEL